MLATGARRLGFNAPGSWQDLAYGAGFFLCYAVADVLSRRAGRLRPSGADGPWLLASALRSNLLAVVVLVIVVAALLWRSTERLLCPWSGIDRGPVLRALAAPILVLLTWQGALYHYNYLLERSHLLDRGLLIVLAVAVLWRPVAIVPFVIQSRAIATQFDFPFGTLAAQNIDELLVIALLCLAVGHLVYVVSGRADSSPVILLLAAAIATHFFIPGRGKVLLNWIGNEQLANIPGNGWTVGWLGQTDGGFARWLAGVIEPIDGPLRVVTVVLELGAVLAAAHHRLLRIWLPLIIGFHIVNFLTLGFWFLGWIVLEVALVVVLSRRDLRSWLDRNLNIARGGLTVVMAAVFGAVLFHPPGLAWYDTPLGYGYEMEVTGESGTVYNLPIEAFAPFSQELAFGRLELGDTRRLTGAYGVVVSADDLAVIDGLENVDQVAALEEPLGPDRADDRERTERFLTRFAGYANRRASGDHRLADALDMVAPLPKYWNGRPSPVYRFQEPIDRLEIRRLTNLRVGDDHQRSRTTVLVMEELASG